VWNSLARAVILLSPRNSHVVVCAIVGVDATVLGQKIWLSHYSRRYPSDADTKKALDNNKEYAVVWTVHNAWESTRRRFNATVNK
jgi:predicted helicase